MSDLRKLYDTLSQINEWDEPITENDVRQMTNKIYEAMDGGILDPRTVAEACMSYMSESDVAEMAQMNGFFEYEDEWLDNDDDETDLDFEFDETRERF